MATSINLATGLGGAIGSDFVQSQNSSILCRIQRQDFGDRSRAAAGRGGAQRHGDYARGYEPGPDQRHVGAGRAYPLGSYQPGQ